jgi:hypothetical protein
MAVGLVFGMVFFAIQTNRNAALINWFGLSTAIGGALAFELTKYAIGIRFRHAVRLAVQVNLTPLKIEEFHSVTRDVERTRKIGEGLASAVELRARELFLQQHQNELVARIESVRKDLLDLADKENRIARDRKSQEASKLAEEMTDVLKSLGASREEKLLDALKPLYPFYGPASALAGAIDTSVRHLLHRLEARRARRVRQESAGGDVGEVSNHSYERPDS